MTPTDKEIADRLRAILSTDEFQPRVSERIWSWLEDAFRSLSHWLASLNPAIRVLVIAVCIVTLYGVAVRVWRSYRNALGPDRHAIRQDVAREEASPSPQGLLSRARSLADEGYVRDAARALQEAMLLQTSREHHLPWRSSLSDWEWMKLLHPSKSVVDFTRATERLAFGPEPSRAEFDACARGVQSLLDAADAEKS